MDKEELRIAFNHFLKMYIQSCNEVYEEIHFDRIRGSRFKYLKEIHRRGETTLTELADHFDLSKPTVNEVIQAFSNNGLIQKERSEEDKRVTVISLTEIGTILATTNTLESKRAVDKMIEVLSPRELKQLKKMFEKFGEQS